MVAPMGACCPFGASEPTAQEKDSARGLMDAGDAHFAARRYADALEAYRAADDIMGVPSTKFAVGKAQEELGLLVEARDSFLAVVRIPMGDAEPPPFMYARAEAAIRQAILITRIPTLEVTAEGLPPGASFAVTIDGYELSSALSSGPIGVDPGLRVVSARSPGFHSGEHEVVLAEGESRQLAVPMASSKARLALEAFEVAAGAAVMFALFKATGRDPMAGAFIGGGGSVALVAIRRRTMA
jgi:hypothetical protein